MKHVVSIIFVLGASFFSASTFAREVEGIDYPETITVDGKTLHLNGAGVRFVDRFGLTFKVYAVGLYLEKKSSDANEILNSKDLRVVKVTFLRRVNQSDVSESISKGVYDNCKALFPTHDCEKVKLAVKPLYDKVPDILNKGTIQYKYSGDQVEFEIKGRSELKGTLSGPEVTRSLLSLSIGPKPTSEKTKLALLGGK